MLPPQSFVLQSQARCQESQAKSVLHPFNDKVKPVVETSIKPYCFYLYSIFPIADHPYPVKPI